MKKESFAMRIAILNCFFFLWTLIWMHFSCSYIIQTVSACVTLFLQNRFNIFFVLYSTKKLKHSGFSCIHFSCIVFFFLSLSLSSIHESNELNWVKVTLRLIRFNHRNNRMKMNRKFVWNCHVVRIKYKLHNTLNQY